LGSLDARRPVVAAADPKTDRVHTSYQLAAAVRASV
jgi:hypothetical protein